MTSEGVVGAKGQKHLFDMHVHTSASADSTIPYVMAVQRARELGLRGIAITDHDSLTVVGCSQPDIVMIPGAELSTEWGDLLAIGISRLPDNTLPVPRIIDDIHAQGGVAVIPHPFTGLPNSMNERVPELIDIIDGLETASPRKAADNIRARKLARQHGKAEIGGSDAHALEEMGRSLTECASPDAEGLLDAIRSGKTRAAGRKAEWQKGTS
jgi:predicted metal-dependent phosphoesterase TrpH